MKKKQAIEKFRKDLNERNADSGFTNQYLYNSLMVHAKWLVRREVSAGRIYRNSSLFQNLPTREVIEVPTVPEHLGIKTRCKIYRTKSKLPEMWLDDDGPVIRSVTSLDGSTSFSMTTPRNWLNKKEDPYQRFSKEKYCFFSEGYLWFPEHNPHLIVVNAFFTDDISDLKENCVECDEDDCLRYLDTEMKIPDWIEGEMFAKALEQVAGITKRLPEDEQIDKNTTRKN